jgi:pimeloyl-ACP methyl ester carboxylesterase
MHYVEDGSGPLVVLLHGFPEFWWSWRHQIEPLVRAGYRVIAPDQRGYNDTDKHGPYDIDTLVSDVCALIDHAGERKAIIVGHDWGGAVAWHLAATRPEHCERLVVMNSPHPVLMGRALTGNLRQMRRSWYFAFFLLPWLPEHWLLRNGAGNVARMMKAAAVDRSRFPREDLDRYREAFLKPGVASAAVGWYRAAMSGVLRVRPDVGGYPLITAPTLLIWAMNDIALGYDDLVPGTEALVSGLRVEKIERCGHFVQNEAPERVNELLLGFLGERH